MVIKYYSDPAHGWYAVKRTVLDQFNVADKITPYSYQNGQTVYLEEDMDGYTLIHALRNANVKYEIVDGSHTNKRSPIRSYKSYAP